MIDTITTLKTTKIIETAVFKSIFSFNEILPSKAPITGELAVIGVTFQEPAKCTASMNEYMPTKVNNPPSNS